MGTEFKFPYKSSNSRDEKSSNWFFIITPPSADPLSLLAHHSHLPTHSLSNTMPLSIDDLLYGDVDDPANFGGAHHDPTTPDCHHNSCSPSDEFETNNPNNIFDLPPNRGDVNMAGPSASYNLSDDITEVCSKLQADLKLDADHLKIAKLACKYVSEAPNAVVIFSNGAYHQLALSKTICPARNAPYTYDKTFKDFVRETAQLILLKPTIDAYSNNPHNDGTIPNSLFYLTLPDQWKEDHTAPSDVIDTLARLADYCRLIADLLKYRRSYLRDMLLTNTQETKKIKVNAPIPNRKDLLTKIYDNLPPKGHKLTEAKIAQQVKENYAMRAQICYCRLVMVQSLAHKSRNNSQWSDINDRLRILRGSSYTFQEHHSVIVLNKDFELFSHKRYYNEIDKTEFTVPTIEEVQASVDGGIVPAILR
ncbi:hypothetical protein PtA15_7A466 [Puccinia triticina]|uniref:Uncharacterized protein n=1 Tax=Puccinia triticina TaxID=208348 RepID=A0ABY7CND1_9BASI|nr:uncharacterized protein PtA15_7A466 [Puccinia triticina]WAQ86738.1 hypothetical protein PtA15_7A466 [Puccinia triticina]